MDGLILIIGLIAWFISSAKKKNKQNQARTAQQRRSAAIPSKSPRSAAAHGTFIEQVSNEGKSIPTSFSDEAAFRGSLPLESLEGECVCEPELDHVHEVETATESVYTEQIDGQKLVDTSAHGIMQAFVMNEILTRPKQRLRRY